MHYSKWDWYIQVGKYLIMFTSMDKKENQQKWVFSRKKKKFRSDEVKAGHQKQCKCTRHLLKAYWRNQIQQNSFSFS
jgi:hypothetical protein